MGAGLYECFRVVLYPDCEAHMADFNTIEKRAGVLGFTIFYILHDKDIYSDDLETTEQQEGHKKGDLKKPHIHIVVLCSKRTLKRFRGYFPSVNEVKVANDKRDALGYLIHEFDSDKYQYSPEEVKVYNCNVDYKTFVANMSINRDADTNQMTLDDIIFMLGDSCNSLTFKDVMQKANEKGIGAYARRNISYIREMINSINEERKVQNDREWVAAMQKDKNENYKDERIKQLEEEVQRYKSFLEFPPNFG